MDDSVYTLDPKEDGDPDLYQAAGQSRPLEELIRRMIVRSSNLATNLLIERIGASTVMDLMRRIEAYDIRVLRGVEDQKAYDAGMNNVTTANDLRIVLRAIADGATFSQASSERMIDILKAQEFNEKIPAGLPPGTPVAHKTGDITGIHHDAAIVFPPGERPYVLVVLTAGFQDEEEADRVIADISRAVWTHRSSEWDGRPVRVGPVTRPSGMETRPSGTVALPVWDGSPVRVGRMTDPSGTEIRRSGTGCPSEWDGLSVRVGPAIRPSRTETGPSGTDHPSEWDGSPVQVNRADPGTGLALQSR
jgi:hypothetical protein